MTGHSTAVVEASTPKVGRTFQAVCEDQETCRCRGPHVVTRVRAQAIADEHRDRTAGLDVTAS